MVPSNGYNDPVIKSAQLRNRYDAWSRLSTPAQAVLNKLGPTDAFDSMAKNFTATEDGLRAQGREPFRDAPSAAAAMQNVDTSPSATAMRMLAPTGNKSAVAGMENMHKRFDSAQAKQDALAGYESVAKRDLAVANAKAKQDQAVKQAEFNNKIAEQKLKNDGTLGVAKVNGQNNMTIAKLTGQLAAEQQRNKQAGEHTKKIGAIDKSIAGLYAKYGSAQARQQQYSRFITDPQSWYQAQGFKDAPQDPAAFAQWVVSQPDAAVRLGLDPHALDAYRQERGYTPQPEQQPQPFAEQFGGMVDQLRQRLTGAAPQQSPQGPQAGMEQPPMPQASPQAPPPQAQAPQQEMVNDPMSQALPPEQQQAADAITVENLPPTSFGQMLQEMRDGGAPPIVIQQLKARYNQAQPGRMPEVEQYVKSLGGPTIGAR